MQETHSVCVCVCVQLAHWTKAAAAAAAALNFMHTHTLWHTISGPQLQVALHWQLLSSTDCDQELLPLGLAHTQTHTHTSAHTHCKPAECWFWASACAALVLTRALIPSYTVAILLNAPWWLRGHWALPGHAGRAHTDVRAHTHERTGVPGSNFKRPRYTRTMHACTHRSANSLVYKRHTQRKHEPWSAFKTIRVKSK